MFHLEIVIKEAKNIIAADSGKSSDPYVTFKLKSESKDKLLKTHVIKKDLNPKWNFPVMFVNMNVEDVVVFKLYDWDLLSSNDSLGKCKMSVGDLKGGSGEMTLSFNTQGTLIVEWTLQRTDQFPILGEPEPSLTRYRNNFWSIDLPEIYKYNTHLSTERTMIFNVGDDEEYEIGIIEERQEVFMEDLRDDMLRNSEIIDEKCIEALPIANKFGVVIYSRFRTSTHATHCLHLHEGVEHKENSCYYVLKRIPTQVDLQLNYRQEGQIRENLIQLAKDMQKRKSIYVHSRKYQTNLNMKLLKVVNFDKYSFSSLHFAVSPMINFGSGSKNGQNLDRSYELSHFTEISLFDHSFREFLVKSIPFLLFPEDLTFGKVYPRRIFVDRTAHILANFSVSGPFDRLTQLLKRTHVQPKVIPKKNIFVNDYLMLSMASTVEKGDTFETSIGEKKYTFKADARIEETDDQFMCNIDSKFPISSSDLKSRKDLNQFKKALLVEFPVSYGVFVYKHLISACFWFDINEELPRPSQEEKEEMANFLIENVVKSCYIHNDDLEFEEMCHKPKKKL